MSLYAYLPYEEGKNVQHQSGEIFQYEGNQVWLFQSTLMSLEEKEVLKKQNSGSFKCFSCGEDMQFVSNNNKNNFFRHYKKKDCTLPESFEHAITKLKIYNLFKDAGYTPNLERVFKSNHLEYNPRADVFVEASTGNEKLVIEVQGSKSILPNTIAKRTMAYAGENIPTAWVLILNSYFAGESYAGTTITEVVKHEDGSFSNKVRSLRYDEDQIFTSSASPKSFKQLMNAYGYVIAVNYDGHFFLIRQDVFSKGDIYRISRIPHENLVDVLLTTDLVELDYQYGLRKKYVQEKGNFTGREGFDHEDDDEVSNISWGGIDFEMAFQIEQQRLKKEGRLDPLSLIRQLKDVREFNQREQKRQQYSDEREKKNEYKYKSGIKRFNNYLDNLSIKEKHLNELLEDLRRQKDLREEAIYKWVYEDKINQWKKRMSNENEEDMLLLKQLEKIKSELEQKCIDFVEQFELKTKKESKEREEILSNIEKLKQKGGKKTQQAINQVIKVYGELEKQTIRELTISIDQIQEIYSQENKKEEKKSIEQLREEERIYRENREWRLF